jgi:hypothetical protein
LSAQDQAIANALDARNTLHEPQGFFALGLIDHAAAQLGRAARHVDVDAVMVQLAALPQMVGNGIGECLLGGNFNAWRDGLTALDLKAGGFLPRQGKGHPKPRRGGQKVAVSNSHGFILLTVCA